MHITFATPYPSYNGLVFVPILKGKVLSPAAQKVDQDTGGMITRALQKTAFEGEKGNLLGLPAPANITADKLILFGVGNPESLKPLDLMEIGAHLITATFGQPVENATILGNDLCSETLSNETMLAKIIAGMMLRNYQFIKYKTKLKDYEVNPLKHLTVVCKDPLKTETVFTTEKIVVESVNYVRDLMNEPANILHPESFAADIEKLSANGLTIKILDEMEMEKLGMNALLGVNAGSNKKARLAIMEWKGGQKGDAPLAFVGKGVTFDTGGISIKPSAKMDEMKMDMGGAAVVVGLMKILACRKAPVNVIGVVGLVENMPDGKAQRPGDIVKSYSGQTIEILNTDAEGRLVLADAMWYTQEQYKPKLIIDLATLTGAIVICLGTKYAGLFSNDDTIISQLRAAGDLTGEHVWPLPIDDRYDKDINTPNADVKNTGAHGAGSITAAKFLQRFTNNVPWAHLDIAGVASNEETHILAGRQPRGFGVMLLNAFIQDNYES